MARMTDKDWDRHEYLQADSLRLAGYLTEDEWYDKADAEAWDAYAEQERRSELKLTGVDPDYYDPEAQADLALHNFLHPDGYGVDHG